MSATPTEPMLPDLPGLGSFRRKCLFAVTILLVEDSRSASEAIRLYAAESGARVRRADSLHAASRHLAIYRPNVVMVDLGLPDGSGLELIRHLASASLPMQGIVAVSGNDRDDWREAALEAGAATCLEKPIGSLRVFQECILGVLPDADTRQRPDLAEMTLDRASVRAALAEDLRRARTLLTEALRARDDETANYCLQFLGSVGEMLADAELTDTARAGWGTSGSSGVLTLLDRRLSQSGGARGAA